LSQNNKISEKIRDRDPSVFEDLYREYNIAIYNFLLIKTRGDVDVANDVLSDTFCSLMDSFDKIKNTENVEGYLIQIAYRRLCDFLRKKYHDDDYQKYFEVNEKMEDTITEDLHKKEQLMLVNLAMEKLNPAFKNVLKLRYLEEKSQNEISEIMNRSVSSVETLLVRAKKQLRAELKKLKGFVNEF
jgi:RNA polymerase sigma factor (sigma-70 family)